MIPVKGWVSITRLSLLSVFMGHYLHALLTTVIILDIDENLIWLSLETVLERELRLVAFEAHVFFGARISLIVGILQTPAHQISKLLVLYVLHLLICIYKSIVLMLIIQMRSWITIDILC